MTEHDGRCAEQITIRTADGSPVDFACGRPPAGGERHWHVARATSTDGRAVQVQWHNRATWEGVTPAP